MPAGRPTKYNENILKAAKQYIDGGWIECGDVVPSIAGLGCELGVHRDTLYEWRDKHPDFSDTLRKLDQAQHRVALNGGMNGTFNAAITKLVLHNHGYSDRQQQEVSGPNGGPVQTDNKYTIEIVKPSE